MTKKVKINMTMALKWVIFLPVILPLCLVFGALKGIVVMVDQMLQQMYTDIDSTSEAQNTTSIYYQHED